MSRSSRKNKRDNHFLRRFLHEKLLIKSCLYCNESNIDKLSIEHLTPIIRGGDDFLPNLTILCLNCNNLKGPLTHSEFTYLKSLPDFNSRIKVFLRFINSKIDPLYGISSSPEDQARIKEEKKNNPQKFYLLQTFTEEEIFAISTSKSLEKRLLKKEEVFKGIDYGTFS